MTTIALVTLDSFTDKMAGPAIRMWEMAGALAREGHEVRILSFGKATRTSPSFSLSATNPHSFREDLLGPKDSRPPQVTIIQGYLLDAFPFLAKASTHLVVDLYDPFHLESLEVGKYDSRPERLYSLSTAIGELEKQAAAGDFFLCASERQRDFWLGQLAIAGRLNPDTYDADPTLRRLIDVVPFGMDAAAPVQTRHAAKGSIDGIGPEDKLIIWGGGVYNWFDPLTVIRAIDAARAEIPDIRLLFMGAAHPNPDVPAMKMATRARELVAELGLDAHVFFNEEWVDYADRHNYLLDADIAVSAHFDGIETAFSFRTRILDYLWAGRPIVCTEGDYFAELVAAEGLGAVIPYEDHEAMAQAFIRLLGDEGALASAGAASARVAESFAWARCLEPLIAYCASPRKAGDAEAGPVRAGRKPGPLALVRRTFASLREHGVADTARHISRFIGKQR